MKKKYFVLLLCCALFLCACSIQSRHPSEGIWYCEALNMYIDFQKCEQQDVRCITKHYDDGSIAIYECYFDYGDGISVYDRDNETYPLIGNFKWSGDSFSVTTSNGVTFCFVKCDDSIGSQ